MLLSGYGRIIGGALAPVETIWKATINFASNLPPRLRSEIVATVAAHYQHLTLMAARRAAAKARWKRRKRDGKDGQGGPVRCPDTTLNANIARV